MTWFISTRSGEAWQGGPEDPLGSAGITHDCPSCGGQASSGRALSWITSECIKKGEAVFPCNSCSRPIIAPVAIFVEGVLEQLEQQAYDQRLRILNERMLAVGVTRLRPAELLVPDWGEVLAAWNRGVR